MSFGKLCISKQAANLIRMLQVSSSCDDLLDQLNAISFLGDEHHRDRCTHLRHSLTHLNRAQGLGFEVFGTVIDRRMLVKVAFAMAGSAGTGAGPAVVEWHCDHGGRRRRDEACPIRGPD